MPLENCELELRLTVLSSIKGPLWKSQLQPFLPQNETNEAFEKYDLLKNKNKRFMKIHAKSN